MILRDGWKHEIKSMSKRWRESRLDKPQAGATVAPLVSSRSELEQGGVAVMQAASWIRLTATRTAWRLVVTSQMINFLTTICVDMQTAANTSTLHISTRPPTRVLPPSLPSKPRLNVHCQTRWHVSQIPWLEDSKSCLSESLTSRCYGLFSTFIHPKAGSPICPHLPRLSGNG